LSGAAELTINLVNEDATRKLGARLASLLPAGSVIALNGTLGAGKTRFVQGLAIAAGAPTDAVLSPTYTLIHEYPLPPGSPSEVIYHLDAYRVRDEDEFWELGVEELYEQPAWVIIEWAERVPRCLPPAYLEIQLQVTGPETREAKLIAHGEKFRAMIESTQQHTTDF
jgi:tRNA threonylcarbamoyladenosine biosynthesis protein TsaE